VVKVVDFKPFLTTVGSNPKRDFGFFYVWKLSSWLRERRWFLSGALFVLEIMHRRAPEVFLHQ
jgi:hypothetical protein